MFERNYLIETEYFIFEFSNVVLGVLETIVFIVEIVEELLMYLLEMAQEHDKCDVEIAKLTNSTYLLFEPLCLCVVL